jgi:hypothetical protein
MQHLDYEPASPRGRRAGAILLGLAAISAIACLGLLWGAQHNYYRLAAAGLCALATWLLAKRGKQRRIPVLRSIGALQSLMARTGIPVALYLRRFAEDYTEEHLPPSEGGLGGPDEAQLAAAFSDLFLFVAIGRPDEPLPPWGAYRLYVPDPEWKSQVATLISIASVVIVRCGQSEALRWEIEQLKQASKLDRTLFLLPAVRSPVDRRAVLQDDPLFDIRLKQAAADGRYPAFVTLSPEGVACVHDRDRKVEYGEAAKRVAADAFHLDELTRSGRQVIRGFYGRAERWLSDASLLCLVGAVYGMATAMLCVTLLLLIVLVTDEPAEDAAINLLAPFLLPVLTAAGIVAAVSVGVLVIMLAMMERLVPRR